MGSFDAFLANDPSKRAAEKFFLVFSVVWILLFGSVVAFQWYLKFSDVEYNLLAAFVALPYFLYPLVFPFKSDAKIPVTQRYFFISNVWIAIFSYVGNYFWTHYFYSVLGASYSFPVTHFLNDVPVMLYFITHGYFMFYHTMTTIILRLFFRSKWSNTATNILLVFVLALITAFMETWTISNVPFYSHKDKWAMYTIGSVFYGIYFYVSFPMFYRIYEEDEKLLKRWKVSDAALDSLAACMIVTIFLDLWRLSLGNVDGLPWLSYKQK